MPTEAQLTSKVLAAVRQRWPDAWCYKINDRVTGGIPDAFLLRDGIGVFVEFKKLKRGQSIDKVVRPLQKTTLRRLYLANEGRAIVVAFTPDGQRTFSAALMELCDSSSIELIDYLMMVWG